MVCGSINKMRRTNGEEGGRVDGLVERGGGDGADDESDSIFEGKTTKEVGRYECARAK